jgi:DNA repair protein SbcD/Mre11
VSLPRAEPRLRQRIEAALEGRWPRLVKLTVEHTGDGRALGDTAAPALRELDPDEVFLRRWHRDHETDPPAEVMEAFFELLDQVRQEGAS